jgi:hypothetical protein
VEMPEDAVDHLAMGVPRTSRMLVVGEIGEERSDALPLSVSEFIAVHGRPPFGNLPVGEKVPMDILSKN